MNVDKYKIKLKKKKKKNCCLTSRDILYVFVCSFYYAHRIYITTDPKIDISLQIFLSGETRDSIKELFSLSFLASCFFLFFFEIYSFNKKKMELNLSIIFRVINIIVAAFMIIGGVMTCIAGGT